MIVPMRVQTTESVQMRSAVAYNVEGDPYQGGYEFTPTEEEQTANTSGKVLSQDITIHAIPSAYADVSDTTATASDVKRGKVFYTAEGVRTIGTADSEIDFNYKLSAFTAGVGNGSSKCVRIISGQGAYAGCYGKKMTDNPIYNNVGDGETYYPILLDGATRLSFTVPDAVKVTVFFVNTQQKADTYNAAAWVDGDASAYDANVPNGSREVDVPVGADGFTFSLYYKSNTITDALVQSITVTAS